jgi:hypothetical protein
VREARRGSQLPVRLAVQVTTALALTLALTVTLSGLDSSVGSQPGGCEAGSGVHCRQWSTEPAHCVLCMQRSVSQFGEGRLPATYQGFKVGSSPIHC